MNALKPESHGRLLAHMMGFRKGASGGAFTDEQMNDADFKSGHDAGRKAINAAYQSACKKYGAELSPLRAQ